MEFQGQISKFQIHSFQNTITLTPIEDNNHIYQNQYCSAPGVFHGFDSIMLQGMTITADSSGKITIQVPKQDGAETEEARMECNEVPHQEEEQRSQDRGGPTADDEVLHQEEEQGFQDRGGPIAPSNPYVLQGKRDGVTYIRSLRYPEDQQLVFGGTVKYREHALEDPGEFFAPKDHIYVDEIINDDGVGRVGSIARITSADPAEHFDFAAIERRKENGTYGVYFPEEAKRRNLRPYIGDYKVEDDLGRTIMARFRNDDVADYALLAPRIAGVRARLHNTLSTATDSHFNYWYMYCKNITGPAVLYYHTLEKWVPRVAEKSLPEIAMMLQRDGPWTVALVPEVPGRARRINAQLRVAEIH